MRFATLELTDVDGDRVVVTRLAVRTGQFVPDSVHVEVRAAHGEVVLSPEQAAELAGWLRGPVAGDERRAEIEAVARFYYRWMMGDDYPEFPWDDDNTPSNETKDEAERFAAEFPLDRVRDARGDDAAAVWRSMLDRIRIHGASGLWTGEDCAIGAVAALEGGDAGRAFMLEREAARSPQGEDRRKVHSADCEWVWGAIGCTCGIGIGPLSRPQGEDHEAGIEAAYDAADACFPSSAQGRWLRPAVEAAVAAYLSRVSPSSERDTESGTRDAG